MLLVSQANKELDWSTAGADCPVLGCIRQHYDTFYSNLCDWKRGFALGIPTSRSRVLCMVCIAMCVGVCLCCR